MIKLNKFIILNQIISVVFVITQLNLELLTVSMHLGIVTLIIFMEKTVIITLRRKFCVMERLMIITDSLHVFWSITNVWIMWRNKIIGFRSLQSFVRIIKLKPFTPFLCRKIELTWSPSLLSQMLVVPLKLNS